MRLWVFTIIFSLISSNLWAKLYEYPYNSLANRDPLIAVVNERGDLLIKQEGSKNAFHLEGIIFDDHSKNSIAIIDGEVYKQEDLIGGYYVKEITVKEVFLKKDSETIVLKLEE